MQTYARKKSDNPTEVWGWKSFIRKMVDDAITILVPKSIERNMIKEEKYFTMTFLRNNIFSKNTLGNALKFPGGYSKE